jgi:flagellar protein FliL
MSDAEEKKEGGEETPKPKGKKLIIILLVVLLLGGGGGAFFFLKGGKDPNADAAHEEEKKEEEKHYATAKLDTFIVNLSENSTFLKTTILIEYDPALLEKKSDEHGGEASGGGHGSGGGGEESKEGSLPEGIAKRKPMVHDAVIRVLSSKRSTDVLTPEGKETLKQELIEAINEAIGLEEGPVVNIYFTEFIIQ